MKKSGSPLRIRLCAIVVLLCAVIAGIGLIMQGVDNIDYGTKTSKAAGQSQIIYGVAWLIGGVIVREIINGFSTIVAAHENREASEAPRAAVSKKPADAVNWICSRCRTENAGARKVCEGCGWEESGRCSAP